MKGATLFVVLTCAVLLSANPTPVVNIVGVSQREDASRKVDIYYNISHTMPVSVTLKVSDNNGSSWGVPCTLLTGDIGANISPGNGKHIVWDVSAEHPDIISDYVFRVLANDNVYTIPTDGLIAYYPFNGNANDESGNGNHGTVYGATLATDRVGVSNNACSFDGNDYINIGQLPQLNYSTGITISCWIYKTSSNRVEGFVGKWYSSPYTNNVFLLYNGEGGDTDKSAFAVQYANEYNATAGVAGTSIIQQNQWVHLAATWNGADGVSNIYKSGVLENTDVKVESSNHSIYYNTSYPAVIGNWGALWGANYYMRGKIDDVRIYNRALSESEVQALYHEGGWGL